MSAPALWTVDDMAAAMGAKRQSALPSAISGLSIDTRTIGAGEAFFALADFYGMTGNTAGAAEYYTLGLRLETDNAPALAALGRLQARTGKQQDADRTFERLARTSDPRFRFTHAAYLFQTGRRGAAIAGRAR